MIQIIFTTSLALFSTNSLADGAAISPGIYNEKTGDTLQANCLEWQTDRETGHQNCVKLQFFESTQANAKPISEPIKNDNAAQLSVPANAPVKSVDSKIDAFKLTKKAWGDEPFAMGMTSGSVLFVGLLTGAGVAMKVPGRPKITESQDLSENLPNENGLIYSVDPVNIDVKATEKADGQVWTTFFNEAKNMSPEQRVNLFVELFNYTSASDANLVNDIGPGNSGAYTLVRVEYDPTYTEKQVIHQLGYTTSNHLWTNHYYFVFVPDNEVQKYQQYISNTQASNSRALKWWRQDMYIYFGAVLGTTVAIAIGPTIADLFRDAFVPAVNSRRRRHNQQTLEKWNLAWQNIFNKNATAAMPVSDEIYAALVKTIQTKYPLH